MFSRVGARDINRECSERLGVEVATGAPQLQIFQDHGLKLPKITIVPYLRVCFAWPANNYQAAIKICWVASISAIRPPVDIFYNDLTGYCTSKIYSWSLCCDQTMLACLCA